MAYTYDRTAALMPTGEIKAFYATLPKFQRQADELSKMLNDLIKDELQGGIDESNTSRVRRELSRAKEVTIDLQDAALAIGQLIEQLKEKIA
jgi:hypothetical protein